MVRSVSIFCSTSVPWAKRVDSPPVPMTVIGTGGLSTLFAQGTDVLQKIDTDLTIHGLVLIDRLNRE